MMRIFTLLTRGMAAVVLSSMLLLAGCHRGATKSPDALGEIEKKFDVTLQAYPSGAFLIDGAVLSAADTSSHFAYLRDVGHLPRTVLLLPSAASKIRQQHLQYMARMLLDYGFAVYYVHDGKLMKINPVSAKPRKD